MTHALAWYVTTACINVAKNHAALPITELTAGRRIEKGDTMKVTSVDYKRYDKYYATALFWQGEEREKSYEVTKASMWRLVKAVNNTPGSIERRVNGWLWTRGED